MALTNAMDTMGTMQNAVPPLETQCCIAGCGPAGAMLGFLLARRGIDVVVLEKHGDFLRDFRGDTIHPSTLAVMRAQGWGRIVNISALGALDGRIGSTAVAMAKAALHGLSASLAQQVAAAGILTNAVLPGFILTEKTSQRIPTELLDQFKQKSPTRRITTADEVARVVVFLASDANGHINGELIRISGGS